MTRALALAVVLCLAGPAPAAPDPAEAELRRIVQEMMDAVAPGNWAVWDRYLDETVIYAGEDGRVLGRTELRDELKPLPPGYSGTIEAKNFRIHVAGDTAVVNFELWEHEDVLGQKIEARYLSTEIFVRRGGKWKMIAAQVLALLQDPARVTLEPRALAALAGRYQLAPGTLMTVSVEGDHLKAERDGRPPQVLLPETDTVFFTPGSTRGRKIFVRDKGGKVTRILDRREGRDLVWTRVGGAGAVSAPEPARSRP